MAGKKIEQFQLPVAEPVLITRVDQQNRDGFQCRPHRHDYFEVIWTEDGEGFHCIDFIEYPLRPKIFYLIAPGQVNQVTSHRYE